MRKQDYLLQLIASLSPNEKRYFKLFSVQPGEKRYLDLFDALEGQTQYNATALSKELGTPPNKLATDKLYLTKALLRSLVHYDEDVTETNTVFYSYLEAYALFERRMFDYALDVTDKALARAWYLELFNFIPALLVIKSTCLYSLSRFDEMDEIPALHDKATEAASETAKINLFRAKATNFEMRRQGKEEFDALLKHPLLKAKVEKLNSIRAQTGWFDIHQRYAMFTGQKDKMLLLAKGEVALYEAKPQIKMITPVAYVVAYTRMADSENLAGNLQGAIDVMQTVIDILDNEGLQLSAARVNSLKFYADMTIGCMYCGLEEYEKAIDLFAKRYPHLGERSVYEQYTLNYYYAVALLHTGRNNEALDKVNELLQMNTDTRMDLQPYVRVLMIMLQINIGNEKMVTFLVRTTKAWLKRNHIDNPELATFLGLIYPLANTPVLNRHKIWNSLHKAIQQGTLHEMDKEIQLHSWVDGKMV